MNTIKGRIAVSALAILAGTMFLPLAASADTASEIKAEIVNSSAATRKNLKDQPDSVSKKGSLQFWSSGGLIQEVPAGLPPTEYEQFSLTPKNISVVVIEEGKSAVAMYYSEGSFHEKGLDPVSHYLTRITEVYVKEDGKWKIRAAHYSPIMGGSGTNATAID